MNKSWERGLSRRIRLRSTNAHSTASQLVPYACGTVARYMSITLAKTTSGASITSTMSISWIKAAATGASIMSISWAKSWHQRQHHAHQLKVDVLAGIQKGHLCACQLEGTQGWKLMSSSNKLMPSGAELLRLTLCVFSSTPTKTPPAKRSGPTSRPLSSGSPASVRRSAAATALWLAASYVDAASSGPGMRLQQRHVQVPSKIVRLAGYTATSGNRSRTPYSDAREGSVLCWRTLNPERLDRLLLLRCSLDAHEKLSKKASIAKRSSKRVHSQLERSCNEYQGTTMSTRTVQLRAPM